MVNTVYPAYLSEYEVHAGVNPALKTFNSQQGPGTAIAVANDSVETDGFTDNYPPAYPGQNSDAVLATTFKDDFYFKIRYLPAILNIGAITSDQVRDLYVFNGFFDIQVLSDLTLSNPDGINIIGPATPTDYFPLQLSQYQVSVSIDGPANIDSTLTFDWTSPLEDGTVEIVGTRIITYPYVFQPGTLETYTWLTQVMTSNDGYEQRVRVRNSARKGFDVDTFVNRSSLNFSDNMLYAWRGNVWGVPSFTECRPLDAPTNTSSPVIQVSTAYGDFIQGKLGIIYESIDSFEVFQIDSFDGSSITAAQNISKVFPVTALVAPVVACRMVSSPTRLTNGYQSRISALFEAIENNTLSTSPSSEQYQGIDVYLEEPLVESNFASDIYDARVDAIDYDSSNVEIFSPWTNTKTARRFSLILEGLEEIWNFKLWLNRRAGRLLPFWMPTWEANFNFVNTGLIASQLEVVNDSQNLLGADRIHIAVKTPSQWYFREIDSFGTSGDNILVNLDTPLNIEASEVEFISYLGQKRLLSDRIELEYEANDVAIVTVPIIEVKP